MRRLITIGGFLLVFTFLLSWHPQKVVLRESQSYFPWEPIGPYNLGQIFTRGLRVGNKIYVGTAFGGLYESEDEGRSWRIVSGFALNQNGEAVYRHLSVSALAASENALYVGTGNFVQYQRIALDPREGFNPRRVDTLLKRLDSLPVHILGAVGRPGMGVFVSTDGGQTFSNRNALWRLSYPDVSYGSLYVGGSARATEIIDIAVSGNRIAVLTPDSLFISEDGLQTVRRTRPSAGRSSLRSVAWGADGVLFVTTEQEVFLSPDGGGSFTDITRRFPGSPGSGIIGSHNVVIRSAPSNPSTLYVASLSENERKLLAVWVSSNNGSSWVRISSAQNNNFDVVDPAHPLALALRVDPRDPAHILIGGKQLWEFSPEWGWRRINPLNTGTPVLSLPSPIRDIVFLENGDYLVLGHGPLLRIKADGSRAINVGGNIPAVAILSVAVSPNGDIHATGLGSLSISAHYSLSDPPGIFRLGNFPVGTFTGVSAPLGYVLTTLRQPEYVAFSYQGGRFRLSSERGRNYLSIYNSPAPYAYYKTAASDSIQAPSTKAAITEDRPTAYGPIYPPMALVEVVPEIVRDRNRTLYGKSHLFIATGNRLWYISNLIPPTADSIQYWSSVTPTAISSHSSSVSYATYYGGRVSIPTAMAAALMPDSINCTVWIGTSDGQLYRIQRAQNIGLDRSQGFDVETLRVSPLIGDRTISAIAIHPKNPDLLALAIGSYARPIERIFLTQNATSATPTFTAIHGNLPNIPVYALFFHPDSAAFLLAGTEWGLYRCPDVRASAPVWEEMTGEVIGRVPVTSITWKPYRYQIDTVDRSDPNNPLWEERLVPDPERPIYIGTWGRGIWKLPSRSVTSIPVSPIASTPSISAYPNPFNREIILRVSLPQGSREVKWQLFSMTGQRMGGYTYEAPLSPGEKTFHWETGSLPKGIYVLQVEILDSKGVKHTQTLKLLHQ